ncbi:arylamine N-acetyltransferase family protein [Cupriavidus metallidurans]|uniref:arylamine N-acetyltransferase family protein n=1 Tax=Cupriavidus metallidurans TaxID=119219 RepID=UPI0005622F46|nr:arylamine N-acetyltransferase [Cupriavidus metallidurans]
MLAADEIPALHPDQLCAWLRRIDIAEVPDAPTLPLLNTLIAAQLAHIPFENLDALLGRRVSIDLPSVFEKLVAQGRGGYCFEQNTLLCAGLKALGYAVTPLAARVRWHVPEATPTGLSHMLLRVEVAHESYIADVGFGGPTPDRALSLSLPPDENTPYRLQPSPANGLTGTGFHCLDLMVPDISEDASGWQPIYRFDLTPQPWIDFIPRNWYVSTHPDSHFTHTLMAARTDGDTRLALANGNLSEREPDGSVRKTVLASADAVIDTLASRFQIRLDPALRAALAARLPAVLG